MSPDLQRQIAHAILAAAGAPDAPVDAVAGLVRPARLALHARHYRATVTAALRQTFSRTARVVGDGFFAFAAARFAAESPPGDPILARYGAAFPAFLNGFPAAAQLPYLGDLARLEWLMLTIAQAPHGPQASVADLARIPADQAAGLRLIAARDAALFASRWGVDAIWRFAEDDPAATLDLSGSPPARLLITRRGDTVARHPLDEPSFSFLDGLFSGAPLGGASAAALAVDGAFSAGPVLASALDLGAFAALRMEENSCAH